MSHWQVMCARLANAFHPDDLLVVDEDDIDWDAYYHDDDSTVLEDIEDQ